MTPWLIVLSLLGLVAGSHFVPTPDEVRASFKQAQKFYAAEDYEQAIQTYERINRIESPLLYTAEIVAEVGEIDAPIKEIALYQTGNSHLKRGEENQHRASRIRDSERKQEYGERAAADFERAAAYFVRTEKEASSAQLKGLARNRLINTLYESKDYDRTVEEGRVFLELYPDSGFLVNVLYNIGWAHYDADRYEQSIEAFKDLIHHFPRGYRADRALFQIGEAYYKRELYGDAVPWYQDVVDRLDIGQMSERDLLKMRREKMAGLVDETALELAAKAQIKIGDCHAHSNQPERAVEAYQKVINAFAQEQRLVSEAYIRLADMYTQNGDLTGAVRTYREAIDGSKFRFFLAGMLSLLAEHFYGVGDFSRSIGEYRLYLDAYGDVATSAGLSPPWAHYKIGRAYYEWAERQRQAVQEDSARASYEHAIAEYEKIERKYPGNELGTAATGFNIGLCHQMIGGRASIARALELYESIVSQNQERNYVRSALFQIARIHFKSEDYRPAIAAYSRILEDYPEDPQRHAARFELALCHRDLAEIEAAVAAFYQLERDSALFPKAMLEANNLLAAAGRYEEGLEALGHGLTATSEPGGQARFYYMKGRTLIEIEDFAAAVEALGRTIDLTADKSVRQGALYGRGVSLLKLERFAAAVDDLKILLESDNQDMATSARRMIGLAHLELGREREAISDYQAMVDAAREPGERVGNMLVLAELHYGLRDYAQVEAVCREILALELVEERGEQSYFPKEKAYFLLGDAHGLRNDMAALITTYKEALSRYPDSHFSGDMRFALGQALFEREDLESAAQFLSTYLEKSPGHSNRAYGLYYLGYALFNLTRFDRAAEVFAELAADYSGGELAPDALFRAGEARYNLGQFEQARAFYQSLVEVHPKADLADDALYNQAWSLLNLKREEEAIALFRQMPDVFPASPLSANAQFTVGDFYYNQEKYEEALAAYEVVQQRFPDSKVAQKIPALMADLREVVAYLQYAEVEKIFAQALEEKKPDQFRRASEGFARIVERYPGTESEIGALSNMGVCYESLNEWKKAVEIYDRVLSRFSGEEAELAEAYRFARMHKAWIETNRL